MSTSPQNSTTDAAPAGVPSKAPAGIDPRGPRFGAALTAILLLAVIVLAPSAAAYVIAGIVVAGFLGMFVCGGPVYVAGVTTSAINLSLIMALSPLVVLLFALALWLVPKYWPLTIP